jgi:hypothetical protein
MTALLGNHKRGKKIPMWIIRTFRPASHYQVDLTGLPDEHTHHQVDLTGMAEKIFLSGLLDT